MPIAELQVRHKISDTLPTISSALKEPGAEYAGGFDVQIPHGHLKSVGYCRAGDAYTEYSSAYV